jgi:hypothetical protein
VTCVQPESIDELLTEARRATFRPDDTIVVRIDAALSVATEPGDIGKLLVAKAVAVQGPRRPGHTRRSCQASHTAPRRGR